LESGYRQELQNLLASNALPRLWAKDSSLWPVAEHQAESLKSNLGWLDLPERLGPLLSRLAARAAMIEPSGFEDIVFVAVGDSSLAAETVLRLPTAKLGKRSFLLDTIDPESVRTFDDVLHLDKSLFIFANKSGKHLETHFLLLYFLEKLRTQGIDSPARHFVTLTEENSYLGQIAGEYDFLDIFLDPPGISGRFSSLIHFNFFLAALCRLNPGDLLARTQSMRDACGSATPPEANPALSLSALLAAADLQGLDRLVFFTTKTLRPVSRRIGDLVGASTCKNGRGIIPIIGRTSGGLEMFQKGCVVVSLKIAGEDCQEPAKRGEELREAGAPVIDIQLNGPEDLAVELFKWEIATALSCSLLCVDPFHDPDTGESRARSVQILEQGAAKQQSPAPTFRVREGDLELYAEGKTRQQISTLNMTEALRAFFDLRHHEGYIALLPFLSFQEAHKQVFRRIRDRLESTLGLPVLITPGPRYLHGIGQVYKGGPAKGLFLLLTADPLDDIVIPGADYSFGQLQLALALGDFESLGRRRRPVIRLHLTCGTEKGLPQLESILDKVLEERRTLTP
jgi:transaldolase/glucose-6-phosphate isomerase